MKLYHGTTSRHLPKILVEGLTPNKHNLNSNWDHTVASIDDRVYLTNAYALYFAGQAVETEGDADQDVLAIVEVDTDLLDEDLFVADEDAVEQANRGQDDLPDDWSAIQRTMYYWDHAHEYSWEGSLKVLGTCAYQNIIPPEAITRIALISIKKYSRLVMGGYDPFISVQNYRIMGAKYRHASQWLFDAGVEQEVDESNAFSAIMTMMLPEERTGIDVLTRVEAKERFVVAAK
jgi:hypothetical protein